MEVVVGQHIYLREIKEGDPDYDDTSPRQRAEVIEVESKNMAIAIVIPEDRLPGDIDGVVEFLIDDMVEPGNTW